MAETIENIIKSCLPAIGLPRTAIPTDLLQPALDILNNRGRAIWDSWPWDNTKIETFTISSAVNGVITMPANVDVVRAVRAGVSGSTNSTLVWNEDEVLAAIAGQLISTDAFQHLPDDDTTGYRRILVEANQTGPWYVLALKRYTPVTTANYTTATFGIDRAEEALRGMLSDGLRALLGLPEQGSGQVSLQIAKARETDLQNREVRLVPRSPIFQSEFDEYP